jgi:hypothetical protein
MVGNRDREIMRDPYLLGFEIVEKNEDNSRLLGVFAFRVNREILFVVVIYVNGQCKGFDLLYRKGKNRFTLNNEKRIKYLLSQDEDREGRPVGRNQGSNRARMHLGLADMYTNPMSGGFKRAADTTDNADAPKGSMLPDTPANPSKVKDPTECGSPDEPKECKECGEGKVCTCKEAGVNISEFIKALWDETGLGTKTAAELLKGTLEIPLMLRQVLVDADLGSKAASLVERLPELGDYMVLANSLEAPVTVKQAAAPQEPSCLIWHAETEAGWPESKVAAFYERGYLLEDKRAASDKATVFETINPEQRMASAHGAGVMNMLGRNGGVHKALFGPRLDFGALGNKTPYYGDSPIQPRYEMLFLAGPHKDTTYRCPENDPGLMPLVSEDVDAEDDMEVPDGSEPKAGNSYMLWDKNRRCFCGWGAFQVYSAEKVGEAVRLNGDGCGSFATLRRDIDISDYSDDRPIFGADIAFFPVGKCKKDEPCCSPCGSDTTSFVPLTLRDVMFGGKRNKTASVVVKARPNGLTDLMVNDKWVCTDMTPKQTILKLANGLRMEVTDSQEIVDSLAGGGERQFTWISPFKRAALNIPGFGPMNKGTDLGMVAKPGIGNSTNIPGFGPINKGTDSGIVAKPGIGNAIPLPITGMSGLAKGIPQMPTERIPGTLLSRMEPAGGAQAPTAAPDPWASVPQPPNPMAGALGGGVADTPTPPSFSPEFPAPYGNPPPSHLGEGETNASFQGFPNPSADTTWPGSSQRPVDEPLDVPAPAPTLNARDQANIDYKAQGSAGGEPQAQPGIQAPAAPLPSTWDAVPKPANPLAGMFGGGVADTPTPSNFSPEFPAPFGGQPASDPMGIAQNMGPNSPVFTPDQQPAPMSLTQPPELSAAGPTREEWIRRLNKDTGGDRNAASAFNENSAMDRLNLERLMVGDSTFDTKQYRQHMRNPKVAADQTLVKLAAFFFTRTSISTTSTMMRATTAIWTFPPRFRCRAGRPMSTVRWLLALSATTWMPRAARAMSTIMKVGAT